MPAPHHIWPPARIRFAPDQQLAFIDIGKVYMISKRTMHEVIIPFGVLGLFILGWLLA
ncbi:MAG: hypothetical protein ACR2P3_09520 [Geminicoccaceae bacterium]